MHQSNKTKTKHQNKPTKHKPDPKPKNPPKNSIKKGMVQNIYLSLLDMLVDGQFCTSTEKLIF